jgi:hypothetical protein
MTSRNEPVRDEETKEILKDMIEEQKKLSSQFGALLNYLVAQAQNKQSN